MARKAIYRKFLEAAPTHWGCMPNNMWTGGGQGRAFGGGQGGRTDICTNCTEGRRKV